MNRIDSASNPQIKMLRSLQEKKGRRAHGVFLVEGEKMVAEAVRDCPGRVRRVYAADSWEEALPGVHSVWRVADSLLQSVSSHTTPQGIAAVVAFEEEKWKPGRRVLVLDGVKDPGNLGTLLRTAEAFGFSALLLPRCADPYNPKSVQASMGSVLRVPFKNGSIEDLRELAATHRMYGADLNGKEVSSLLWSSSLAIVLGSESHGLSVAATDCLHETVRLPMQGKTESLNVGIAGGILMYLARTAE